MDKKISTFVTIGILVIGLIAVGYYFSYQKPDLIDEPDQESKVNQESEQSQLPQVNTETIIGDRVETTIEDGVFQKTEDNLIYFYPKDKEEVEIVELTGETTFLEITFSVDLEVVSEKEISLTNLQEGDAVSIIVSEERTAIVVRHMIVMEPIHSGEEE